MKNFIQNIKKSIDRWLFRFERVLCLITKNRNRYRCIITETT